MEILVTQCPALYKLKLEDNQIDSIDKLKVLEKAPLLQKFNLIGNPVCTTNEKYKEDIFKIFPEALSVDDTSKEGDNVESTSYAGEEEGDFEGEEFEDGEEDLEGEEFEDGEDDIDGEGDEDDDVDEDDEGEDDDEDDEGDEESSKKKKKKE